VEREKSEEERKTYSERERDTKREREKGEKGKRSGRRHFLFASANEIG
jgi:hypothetical protein